MSRSEDLDSLIALFAARMDVGGALARDGASAAEMRMVTCMQNLAVMGLFSGWRLGSPDPDVIVVEVDYGGARVIRHEFPFSLLTPENAVAMEIMWS